MAVGWADRAPVTGNELAQGPKDLGASGKGDPGGRGKFTFRAPGEGTRAYIFGPCQKGPPPESGGAVEEPAAAKTANGGNCLKNTPIF